MCWLRAAFAVALDALHRELERDLPVQTRVAIDLVDVALDVLGVVPYVQEAPAAVIRTLVAHSPGSP